MINAADILAAAKEHLANRAATYDADGEGERSMAKTVEIFNTLTGHGLTVEQGWLFMVCLKLVRSQQGKFKRDNYEDGAAYFALACEEASAARTKETPGSVRFVSPP